MMFFNKNKIANICREFEKQKKIFKQCKDRDGGDNCEFLRMCEERKSRNGKDKVDDATETSKKNREALNEDLKKVLAERGEVNGDETNEQKKSTHVNYAGNATVNDEIEKRPEKERQDAKRQEAVKGSIEIESMPELARIWAKRGLLINEDENAVQNSYQIEEEECRHQRSSSVKVKSKTKFQNGQFPEMNAGSTTDHDGRKISSLKRNKSMSDVHECGMFQSRRKPVKETTVSSEKKKDEIKTAGSENSNKTNEKEKSEHAQPTVPKTASDVLNRRSEKDSKKCERAAENIEINKSGHSPELARAFAKLRVPNTEERMDGQGNEDCVQQSNHTKENETEKDVIKTAGSENANKTNEIKRSGHTHPIVPETASDVLNRRSEKDSRKCERAAENIEINESGHSPELARAFAKLRVSNTEERMDAQGNNDSVQQSNHTKENEAEKIETPWSKPVKEESIDPEVLHDVWQTSSVASDRTINNPVEDNPVNCETSESKEVSGRRTEHVAIDSSDKNIMDVGTKPLSTSSTDGQATALKGKSTKSKEKVTEVKQPNTKPALLPKPMGVQQNLDDCYSENESADGSSTLEVCSTDYPNESGVDLRSYSATGSDELSRIEYMIEVFMPYIKHQIKVTDIIDYLPLSEREKDIVLSKHAFCASDAFELLISMMKKNKSQGKWQAFRNALQIKGFEYIKLLIDGKTEVDHDANRQLLKLVREELVKRIDAQSFLDIVFEKKLLTEGDKSLVDAQLREYGEHAAVGIMLDKIDKYRKDWNVTLIEIFEQKEFCLGDIADLFRFIKNQEPSLTMPVKDTKIRQKVKQSKNIEEMTWRLEHLQGLTPDLGDLKNIGSLEDQNKPTSEEIKSLTVEVRKLIKVIERKMNVDQNRR